MKVYKNCDGEKIDRCSNCNNDGIKYVYTEIRHKRWCDKQKRVIKNYPKIPSWCPLEDYKDEND